MAKTASSNRRKSGPKKATRKKSAAKATSSTKRAPAKKRAANKKLRSRIKGKILKGSGSIAVMLGGVMGTGIPDRFAIPDVPGYDSIATAEGCWFDADEADEKVAFFHECLTFTIGRLKGEPFILERWQRAIVENLFGWKRQDGTRRYRECLIYVPRKNGKTELVGGLGNILAAIDGEPSAEVYCAAAEKGQARKIFNAAKTMVNAEEELSARAKVYNNSIVFPETESFLQVLSSEAYSKHGFNASGILIDELHAQPNSDLVDVLATSVGSRDQPLTIYITTADFDRQSICNDTYDLGCSVRDGCHDPSGFKDFEFLPVIYEMTKDDDWTSREVWKKANPNYGVSLKIDYMESRFKRAQALPSFANTFKRLHLNFRTGQNVLWLPMEKWDACASVGVDEKQLRGQECFGALDLSSTTDLTAFVLVFREPGGAIRIVPHFWLPRGVTEEDLFQRNKRDGVRYDLWESQGRIELTEGDTVDYDRIRAKVNEVGAVHNIREVAFDDWNATQLTTQLDGDGFTMVKFIQGFHSFNPPCKEFERLVVSGKCYHGGHPILRWMAKHVSIESDAAGNIKPNKKKSKHRIDGIVGAVMGLGRAMVVPPKKGSVYDEREPRVL